MAIAETKVRISLVDAMSKNLQGIYGEMNKLDGAAQRLKGSLSGAFGVGAGIAAGMLGIESLTGAIGTAAQKAWDFSQNMETNRIGMAGILSSMTQLNGKALEWNDALAISANLIDRLNTDALKTAATSEELVTTFRALLGPGLGAGMTIDEIQQLTTTGVNAVKSIGLDGRQLVQELRDLVQGGIQPASSTLATALGLKDADIKAARNSADGLFKFLMDRLQGFERASLETPKTLKGLIDQVDEAVTRTGSIGMEPLQARYKEFLKGIADELISPDSFELNPAAIASVREFSQEAADVASDLADIGQVTGTVIVPAFKLGAEYLGVAADNTKLIAAGFAAWKGAQVASDLYNVAAATNSAYQAQTLLGQAVQKVNSYYDSGRNAARVRYQDEMQAAQQAASVIVQENNKVKQSLKQQQEINNAVTQSMKNGNVELAQRLQQLRYEYTQLGVSVADSAKLQYQVAQQVLKTNKEIISNLDKRETTEVQTATASRNAAILRYENEIKAAQSAAAIVLDAEKKKQAAIKQTQLVEQGFSNLVQSGQSVLAINLKLAAQYYKNLGLSAEEAGKLQLQAARVAAKGQVDLTRQILQTQEAHIKAAKSAFQSAVSAANETQKAQAAAASSQADALRTANKQQAEYVNKIINAQRIHLDAAAAASKLANGVRNVYDKAAMAAPAVSILTGTIASMTDETDGWINEAANMVFQVSLLITSVESLTRAFGALRIARLAALGGPIGLAVGAGVALYDQVQNYNEMAPYVTGFYIDEHGNPQYSTKNDVADFRRLDEQSGKENPAQKTESEIDRLIKGLETKNTTRDLAGVKSAAKAAEAEAKKLQQRYEKYRNQLLETEKDLETKITELTGSSFDIATAELAEEMQKVQSRITNAEVAGVKPEEINKVKELAAAYQELKEAQNIRDNITDMHTLRMDTWQAEYEAGQLYASQLAELQAQELERYMQQLQTELQNTQLTEEQKLELRQQYAEAYTALQEAQAANADAIWDNALEHLKNTQLSQLETLNNGIDGMIGTLTNFGQNMLTEQKSFTERMKDLYSDLANSILNMMMKVIMQGLVMKTIMSAFGIGGGGNLFIDTSNYDIGSANWAVPHFAGGGYAQKGWALVGEEGPELLDLNTPGRIYTAEQTARTLRMANGGGSGSGIENIKVEVRNESGQPVQASSSSASFNGKDMIISVVLQAIQRNEQGSQDMIRAIAQKSG